MNCKKVIKGCASQYAIEELTVIAGHEVYFSGKYEDFWRATDPYLIEWRNKFLKRECLVKKILNNRKLFVFIEPEE